MALTQAQIDAMGKQVADIQAQIPTLTANVNAVTSAKTGLITQPTAPINNANPTPSPVLGQTASTGYTAGQLVKDETATEAQTAAMKYAADAEAKYQAALSNQKLWETNKPSAPDINKITQDTFSQFGIIPQDYVAERKVQLAEIQSLEKQYVDTNARYETYKANIEQQFLPESLGQKKLSYNEKLANIELGKIQSQVQYKQSAMALQQGDFKMAAELAQNSISNALKQYDIEYQQASDTYNTYKDVIDAIPGGQQAFQNSMAVIEQNRADAAAKLDAQNILSQISDRNNYTIGSQTTPGTTKLFTQTQLNKGAAAIRIPIEKFVSLDEDTKNFTINNSSVITKMYGLIDEAKNSGEKLQDVFETIKTQTSLPNFIRDELMKYAMSIFPNGIEVVKDFKWYNPLTWF
jgi:hypothetical protein